MSIAIKQSSSVTFLCIDPKELYVKYCRGDYINCQMPTFDGIVINNVDINKQFGQSPNDNIYCMKNRSGTGTVIATDSCSSDHHLRLCNHCRQPITGEVYKIINDIHYDSVNLSDKKIFIGSRQFHSPGCAYKFALDTKDSKIISYTQAYYNRNSSKPLCAAKPWELLDINGGPLNANEWEDTYFEYTTQPSIIVNVKHMYERYNTA